MANVFTSHLILFSVNLLMSIILFIFILNFFVGVLYRKGILDNISEIFTMTEQFSLSEFFDAPTPYYCEFKAFDISTSLYKICDNSVKPRHFLGADNANK